MSSGAPPAADPPTGGASLEPREEDLRLFRAATKNGERLGRDSVPGERLRRLARSKPHELTEEGDGSSHVLFRDPWIGRAVALGVRGRKVRPELVTEFLRCCEANLRLRRFLERAIADPGGLAQLLEDPSALDDTLARWGLRSVPSPGWGRRPARDEVLDALVRLGEDGALGATVSRLEEPLEAGTGVRLRFTESSASEPRPKSRAPRPSSPRTDRGSDSGELKADIAAWRRSIGAVTRLAGLDQLETRLEGPLALGEAGEVAALLRQARTRQERLVPDFAVLESKLAELRDPGSRDARRRELIDAYSALTQGLDRIRDLTDRALEARSQALEELADRLGSDAEPSAARASGLSRRAGPVIVVVMLAVLATATAVLLWPGEPQDAIEPSPAIAVPRPPEIAPVDHLALEPGDPLWSSARTLFRVAAPIDEREEAATTFWIWLDRRQDRTERLWRAVVAHLEGPMQSTERPVWKQKLAPRLGFRLDYVGSQVELEPYLRPDFRTVAAEDPELQAAWESLLVSLDPAEIDAGSEVLLQHYAGDLQEFRGLLAAILYGFGDTETRNRFQRSIQERLGIVAAFAPEDVYTLSTEDLPRARAQLLDRTQATEHRAQAATVLGAFVADPHYKSLREDLLLSIRAHLAEHGDALGSDGQSERDVFDQALLTPLRLPRAALQTGPTVGHARLGRSAPDLPEAVRPDFETALDPGATPRRREDAARRVADWAQSGSDDDKRTLARAITHHFDTTQRSIDELEHWRRSLAPRLGFRLDIDWKAARNFDYTLSWYGRPFYRDAPLDVARGYDDAFVSLDREHQVRGAEFFAEHYRGRAGELEDLVLSTLLLGDQGHRRRLQREVQHGLDLRIVLAVETDPLVYSTRVQDRAFVEIGDPNRAESDLRRSAVIVAATVQDPFYADHRRRLVRLLDQWQAESPLHHRHVTEDLLPSAGLEPFSLQAPDPDPE